MNKDKRTKLFAVLSIILMTFPIPVCNLVNQGPNVDYAVFTQSAQTHEAQYPATYESFHATLESDTTFGTVVAMTPQGK